MSCSSTLEAGKPLQSLVGFVPGGIVPVQLSLTVCPAVDGTVTLPPWGVQAPTDPVEIKRVAAVRAAASDTAYLSIYLPPRVFPQICSAKKAADLYPQARKMEPSIFCVVYKSLD